MSKKLLKAKDVKTAKDAIKLIKQRKINKIKLAACDIDGVLRGKYISSEKFISSIHEGLGFCDVIFAWDCNDELYKKDSVSGNNTGYPDAHAFIDVRTCRELPLEDNSIMFLLDFSLNEKYKNIGPRSLLKRIIKYAEDMNLEVLSSVEYEFFMFNETPKTIREKNYKNLEHFTPGMFGYSILRSSVHSDFYYELMDLCEKMSMPIEALHTETGPGVIEAALKYGKVLKMADSAVLFKTFVKVFAQKKSYMATFMAKCLNDYPGQSGHLHISILDKNKKNIFYDKKKKNCISDEMLYFIGGQQKLLPELLCMYAPTCNSYTRLIPGFWAPTQATWGVDNRTCALRAIIGSSRNQRVEFRVTAADINPYIALSAAIASGLWGIKNKILPSEEIKGSAYTQKIDKKYSFSRTLHEAAQKLKNSEVAKELFGEEFVKHYVITREHEASEQLKAITDWQLNRYFEII